jgi:sugar-specific transcriptional regulator TrmB
MEAKLREIGLTKYESNIYLALLSYGELSAKDIAKYSKVPPTAVYPNLKLLLQKEMVQQFEGEVRSYSSIDSKIAIPKLVSKRNKQLLKSSEELISELDDVEQKNLSENPKEVLTLSKGKGPSVKLYYEAYKNAKKRVYIMGWRLHTVRDKYTVLHAIKLALNRGVEVKLILFGRPEKAWSLIKTYEDAGVKIKYYPMKKDSFTMLLVDGKASKITLKDRKFPEKYNLHVSDENLAAVMETYFLTIWKKARKLNPEQYL